MTLSGRFCALGVAFSTRGRDNGNYYIPGSGTSGYRQLSFSDPSIFNEDQVIVNGDYLINSEQTLATRYFYSRHPQIQSLGGLLPGSPSILYYSNTNAVTKLTSHH